MTTTEEQLAETKQIALNADKRVDDFHRRFDECEKYHTSRFDYIMEEISLDRKVKHTHATEITRHSAILASHEGLLSSITDSIREGFREIATPLKELSSKESAHDKRITRIEIMAASIVIIGGASLAAFVYIFNIIGTKMGWF